MNVHQLIDKQRDSEKLSNPDKFNKNIRDQWIRIWAKNAVRNYHRIVELFKKNDRDASRTLAKASGENMLLLGSGPSLNDIEPYLKDWKGEIMISSSQLMFCQAIGIQPTYCVIIDADPAMTYLVEEVDTKNITLLTHPNMDHELLMAWKGDIRFFRMYDPGDDFFKEYMQYMYDDLEGVPGVMTYVLNSGNVCNTMIALSQFLCRDRNIFLAGMDLAFPGDKYRFANYKKVDFGYEQIPQPEIPKDRYTVIAGNGLRTDPVNCFYKYSTMIIYGMDGANLYSCSRGILEELPHMCPECVVREQGEVPKELERTPEEKYKIAQHYLRYRGIYVGKMMDKVHDYKRKPKNWKKTKKRIIKYLIFRDKLKWFWKPKPHPTPEQFRRQFIHPIYNAPQVMLKVWRWIFQVSPDIIKRVRKGQMFITNKYHLKGWGRWKLVLRFYLGRLVKKW